MKSNDFQIVFQKSKGLPWQTMGEDTLIIEPQNQMSHEIVGAGSFVWSQIDGETPLAQIIEKVFSEFDAPEAEISKDIMAFVSDLQQKGLIQCRV